MPASPEATNVADARARLYRIKQARQPITEAIDHLQEHVEITQKQLEDTRVVDEAMELAEQDAQIRLDAAMRVHERRSLFVDEPGSVNAVRKISDNPQA